MSTYYVGSRPRDEPPPIYDLYGVVNHHVGILGGHYTSYVRCADKSNTALSEVGKQKCCWKIISSLFIIYTSVRLMLPRLIIWIQKINFSKKSNLNMYGFNCVCELQQHYFFKKIS